MTLTKIDNTLKGLGLFCAAVAGAAIPGIISPAWAIGFGLAGLILNGLASSPLFDPSLVGKTPWLSRCLASASALAGLVSASSFFPQVQQLMSPGHAEKLAAVVIFVAQFAARFAQSGVIAGGTMGAGGGGPVKLVVALLGLSLCASTGCAHMQPFVGPVVACAGVDIAPYAGRIAHDLATSDFADLDVLAVEKGIPFVACVIRAFISKTNAGPATRNGSEWLKARDVRFVD